MAKRRTPARTWRSKARAKSGARIAAKRLGRRLRQLREAEGISQEAAAEEAELDGKHWQAIEAGATNPTLATLVALASALGVGVRDLFDDS